MHYHCTTLDAKHRGLVNTRLPLEANPSLPPTPPPLLSFLVSQLSFLQAFSTGAGGRAPPRLHLKPLALAFASAEGQNRQAAQGAVACGAQCDRAPEGTAQVPHPVAGRDAGLAQLPARVRALALRTRTRTSKTKTTKTTKQNP